MLGKENYIKFDTGKESVVAFLDEDSLKDFCKNNRFTIENGVELGNNVLNENKASIGYITKPGYGITLKDPDYKWIIAWT